MLISVIPKINHTNIFLRKKDFFPIKIERFILIDFFSNVKREKAKQQKSENEEKKKFGRIDSRILFTKLLALNCCLNDTEDDKPNIS
jgi:hypothetical protein